MWWRMCLCWMHIDKGKNKLSLKIMEVQSKRINNNKLLYQVKIIVVIIALYIKLQEIKINKDNK
jgi:hypothetical protein